MVFPENKKVIDILEKRDGVIRKQKRLSNKSDYKTTSSIFQAYFLEITNEDQNAMASPTVNGCSSGPLSSINIGVK